MRIDITVKDLEHLIGQKGNIVCIRDCYWNSPFVYVRINPKTDKFEFCSSKINPMTRFTVNKQKFDTLQDAIKAGEVWNAHQALKTLKRLAVSAPSHGYIHLKEKQAKAVQMVLQ